MYTIGNITLTPQALSMFIVYTVLSLVVFWVSKSASAFVLLFATGCYMTYVTNCTVVGKCTELAWVMVGLTVLSSFLVGSKTFKLGK